MEVTDRHLKDVLVGNPAGPVHESADFVVCDIICGPDMGCLVDCYVWIIVYGP